MRPLYRVGAALLLLELTGCGDVVARAAPTPTPPPATARPLAAASAAPARPTAPAAVDAAAAIAVVRAQVTAIQPLLPSTVPAGMQAIVTAAPDSYQVEYTDDAHVRTILVLTGAPLGINGPHQVARSLPFRGATAWYFINDTTDPTSRRQLYWQAAQPRSELYTLITTGFTEDEFWAIANSLQPV